MDQKQPSELEKVQHKEAKIGFVQDLLYFLLTNKRWWLTPILVILLLMSLLTLLSTSAVAPFIYSLF